MRKIIAPFGEPIEGRPAVPTEEERLAERAERRREKDLRRGKVVKGVERIEGVKEDMGEINEDAEKEGRRIES